MNSGFRLFPAAIAVFATVVAAGCKETYKSPQAFIEKFGQELYSARYGKAMEWMGYEKLVLSDAKVGIDQYRGEYVSATATIVPKVDLTYHKRVAVFPGAWRMCRFDTPYELSRYAGERTYQAICRKVENIRRDMPQPLVYEAAKVDMASQLAPACVIRVYRAKDGSGIYHPVSGRGQDTLEFYDTDNKYRMSSLQRFNSDVGGIVSSDMIKRFNGIKAGSHEAAQSAIAYSNAIARANAAFAQAREACSRVGSLDQKIRDEYVWVTRKVNDTTRKLNAEARESESMAYKMKKKCDYAVAKCEASIRFERRKQEQASKNRVAAQAAFDRQQAQIAKSEGRRNIGQSVIDRMKKQAAKYAAQIEQANADEQAASEEAARLEGELPGLKEKAEKEAKKCEKDIADAKAKRDSGIEQAEMAAKAEHAELLKEARAAAETAADEILAALRGINANPPKAEKANDTHDANQHDSAGRNNVLSDAAVDSAVKKGRSIFTSMTAGNVSRCAMGLPGLWPPLSDEDGLSDDPDDIAGVVFKSSSEYFAAILRLNSKRPIVGIEPSWLNLSSRSVKDKWHCDWIVMAGVTDEMPDDVPVMISANVDYNRLPFTAKVWKFSNEKIPVGKAAGRTGIPWGDDYVVVVRKNGKAEAIKAAELTPLRLLGKGGAMQFRATVMQGNKTSRYLDVK